MPFKASVNGNIVTSVFLSEGEWEELKKSKPTVKMLCCGNSGHMKQNKYGTKYFVHNRRGDCNSQQESPEHLFLKDKIAQICKKFAPFVDVEKTGTDWIADVYVENEDQNYVFEIQLSEISVEEIILRSNKYIRDGIIPIWIVKKWKNHPLSYTEEHILIEGLPNSIGFDYYLSYLREYGFLVVQIENFDELYKGTIHFKTIFGEEANSDQFIELILTHRYIDSCKTEIDKICEKNKKLIQFRKEKKSLEILEKPYTYQNGKSPICPHCGNLLKRELVIHRGHYFQAGIRCIGCKHFEGDEEHLNIEYECDFCKETDLIVFELLIDNEGENYSIQSRCLNCENVEIITKGLFSQHIENYINNFISIKRNQGKIYFDQNHKKIYPKNKPDHQNSNNPQNGKIENPFKAKNMRKTDHSDSILQSDSKSTTDSSNDKSDKTYKNEENFLYPVKIKDGNEFPPNLGFTLTFDAAQNVHAIKCLNCDNAWDINSQNALEDKFTYKKYGRDYGQMDVICKKCNSKYLHR